MSYIRNQIASAIRSRLAEGLTGARDLTASPFPVSAEGLPAYAVKLQPISTQVAGMGSPDFIVEDRASVLVWDEGDQSAESDLWAFAREVAEIVNGAPDDLGGLVLRMVPALAEVRPHAAERRVWAIECGFDLLYVETPAPEQITSGSVRAQMMTNAGGTFAGGERVSHRQRDRTNVAIARPWFEFYHGRIAATGAVGQELETGLTSGTTNHYRAAILTGISGTGKNQAAATLTRATFFGMQGVDGCTVSADGYTVTVPNGTRFRTDRFDLSLAAGAEYFVQTETVAANGSASGYPVGRYRVPALGDLSFNAPVASTGELVFSKDWSAVWDATPGGALGPIAVLGGGTAPVVIVDGDSIIAESARPGTGHSNSDVGDAWAVKCFAKRALNAAGYAFIDVSVSGTNVGNLMAGYGRNGLRAALMAYGSALITDHLHNDRRSGIGFEAVGGWSEASPATWNNTGLRVRYAWHNDWLRGKLRPGARIVRCTLAPATDSSNGWATVAGQTGRNDDATWAADYATGAGGDQFKLGDLIMRRGAYAALAYGGPSECDAGFDLYAALGGTADGKWPAGGTGDRTHPSETLQAAAAADLGPRLPALLGF